MPSEHDPRSGIQHEEVVPIASAPRHEWCPHCATTTLATVTISALTSAGIYTIGEYASCEECGWSPYAQQGGSDGRA